MKRTYYFLLTNLMFLALASPVSAQFKFGVKAGLNLANVAAHQDLKDFYEDDYIGIPFKPSLLPSFHAGVFGEYNFHENMGIDLGIQVSGKGYQLKKNFDDGVDAFQYEEKSSPLYLQIPVNFHYRKSGFYGAVGPYVAFGLAGKSYIRYEEDNYKQVFDRDLKFSNNFDENEDMFGEVLRPLDVGAGIELGYEWKFLRFTASYSRGFLNVHPAELEDLAKTEAGIEHFSAVNQVICVSVAYVMDLGSKAEK